MTIELQSLRNTTVEVVPIFFGALGSLLDTIFTNLSLLQITDISNSLPAAKDRAIIEDCNNFKATSGSPLRMAAPFQL